MKPADIILQPVNIVSFKPAQSRTQIMKDRLPSKILQNNLQRTADILRKRIEQNASRAVHVNRYRKFGKFLFYRVPVCFHTAGNDCNIPEVETLLQQPLYLDTSLSDFFFRRGTFRQPDPLRFFFIRYDRITKQVLFQMRKFRISGKPRKNTGGFRRHFPALRLNRLPRSGRSFLLNLSADNILKHFRPGFFRKPSQIRNRLLTQMKKFLFSVQYIGIFFNINCYCNDNLSGKPHQFLYDAVLYRCKAGKSVKRDHTVFNDLRFRQGGPQSVKRFFCRNEFFPDIFQKGSI